MPEIKVGFQIGSSLASKHLIDSQYIKGSYMVVQTVAERNALPVATVENDGVIQDGSLVFVVDSKKLYIYDSSRATPWKEVDLGGGGGGTSDYLYLNDEDGLVYIQSESSDPIELNTLLGLIERTSDLETSFTELVAEVRRNIVQYHLHDGTGSVSLDMKNNQVYTYSSPLTRLDLYFPRVIFHGFIAEVIFRGTLDPSNVHLYKITNDGEPREYTDLTDIIYYIWGKLYQELDYDVSENNTVDLIFQFDGINFCCYVTQYNKEYLGE